MDCLQLDRSIEEFADGSRAPDGPELAHLASCTVCASRLAEARTIEQLLALREIAAPATTFTASVLARVGDERWKTERVIDLGFNLAIAAGILVIVAGGAGLAWSLGFLSITIDLEAFWQVVGAEMTGRFLSQLQTVVMAAALLTSALVLWWLAETDVLR